MSPSSNHEEENSILVVERSHHPSNPELGHSIHEEKETPQPSNQQEHQSTVGSLSPVDSGDMVSRIAFSIGASHDEVRRETLITIEAHQPQERADTHLQAVNLSQDVFREQPRL